MISSELPEIVPIDSLVAVQDQSRLFKQHPDIASLSPGRIGKRFLDLRGMGIDSEVVLTALLAAPVLFSWESTCMLQISRVKSSSHANSPSSYSACVQHCNLGCDQTVALRLKMLPGTGTLSIDACFVLFPRLAYTVTENFGSNIMWSPCMTHKDHS